MLKKKKIDHKSNLAPKIAKGAAALSVAAGMIAAGAALADEETRGKLGESVENLREFASDFKDDPQQGYQVVAHSVSKGAKKAKRETGKKISKLKG